MLDVNWLTPAKRRQLNVVGEEGMFELDYLTQRLTFTRAGAGAPRLIAGYAPTFSGDVAELPVANAEPLAAELDAFLKVVREGGRPVVDVEDGLWAVADRHFAPGRRRRRPSDRPVRFFREAVRRMTITNRPSSAAPACSADRSSCPPGPASHAEQRLVSPWRGEPGTAGRVTIVGAGKMGLPLAVQFAGHGWDVTAVDVQAAVVDSINAGQNHVTEEPGLTEGVASAHAAGPAAGNPRRGGRGGDGRRRRPDRAGHARRRAAARLSLHGRGGRVDRARASIPARRSSSRRPCRWATPASRFGPRLEAVSGLAIERDFFVAFSPERLYSGAALKNLATYPKLVGGLGPESGARAAAFYGSVLDAEIVLMSSAEAAEFSKLADTTYRDVNIALANEFARYADRVGVDIQEVIAAANSQPYSHIHQPGLGVGGHCIPVYPHFLLSRAPEMELVELSRRVNDGQIGLAIRTIQKALGGLEGVPVLVLGLTYRDGVKELAYSRALPLIERLAFHGAIVEAYDPLLSDGRDRPQRGPPVRLGHAQRGPGDHHPDGRSAVRVARLQPVPRGRDPLRRAEQPAPAGPARAGRLSRRGGARARPAARSRLPPADADCQRGRDATAADQGGRPPAAPAGPPRRDLHRHGPALRRGAGRGVRAASSA